MKRVLYLLCVLRFAILLHPRPHMKTSDEKANVVAFKETVLRHPPIVLEDHRHKTGMLVYAAMPSVRVIVRIIILVEHGTILCRCHTICAI